MAYNYKMFDGAKSVSLDSDLGWRGSQETEGSRVNTHYKFVSVANRCVNVRAATLSSLPWSVVDLKTRKPIFSSDKGSLPPELKFMRNFKRNLFLTEASLSVFARSYLYKKGTNRSGLIGLQWLMAKSVEPIWDNQLGLTGFRRFIALDGKEGMTIPANKICFIAYPNPMHETAFTTSPLEAVASEAGVIFSINEFAQQFIERGAVRATVLQVEQSATPQARQELKNWWKRVATGIRNSWTTEVISAAVVPVVIGEGIREIAAVEISSAKANEIATGMGVPHSLVFGSSANYATAGVDISNFYNYTILPDAMLIEEELNDKIFNELGYYLQFDIERITALNRDNVNEASAYKLFIDAGVKPSVAVALAGVSLPDEFTPAQLDADYEKWQEAQIKKGAQSSQEGTSAAELARGGYQSKKQPLKEADAAKLAKWAKRRLSEGKELNVDEFESDFLSKNEKIQIIEEVAN